MEATPDTLLFLVTYREYVAGAGLPPDHANENFVYYAAPVGKLMRATKITFNPKGELFAVRGADVFSGHLPLSPGEEWFTDDRKVGTAEWGNYKFLLFDPQGELYAVTNQGDLFKGPAPTDKALPWKYHTGILMGSGKIVSLEPQALATQKTFTNSSGQPHKYSFSVSKEITTTSTFSHDQSYTVSTKSEITFSAGIPSILETEGKISINRSTTRTWNFTETNTITTSFSATTDVTLAPNTSLCMQAFVTKGVMEIPYRARVRSYFGYEFTIEGVYKGATVFNLTVKQTDCKSLASTSASRAGLL
uniref:Tachylectin 2 domain-containing protein n=1 Tax=Leptobrachium leishanense TaxID=445787 RepID=A0A8C5QF11_9ANUR